MSKRLWYVSTEMSQSNEGDQRRTSAIEKYRRKVLEHKELEARVKKRITSPLLTPINYHQRRFLPAFIHSSFLFILSTPSKLFIVHSFTKFRVCGGGVPEREDLRTLTTQYDKTEDDLKAIQNVGQIIGELLKQLSEDKCKKLSSIYFAQKKNVNHFSCRYRKGPLWPSLCCRLS